MRKRLLAMFIIFCMVFGLLPTTGWAEADTDSIPLTSTSITIEAGKTYTISNAAQLKNFKALVEKGNTFAGATVELTDDISLADGTKWIAIGASTGTSSSTSSSGMKAFSGTFDGKGHLVDDITIDIGNTNKYGMGFFAKLTNATVKNLKIGVATFTANSNYYSFYYLGGIAGYATGSTIDNCYVSGSPTISLYTSTGIRYVGGIVGYSSNSTISNCTSELNLDFTRSGYEIGGIVGIMYGGKVVNCINKGTIGSKAAESNGAVGTGGIVGKMASSATIDRCVNKGTVTCYSTGTSSTIYANFTGGICGTVRSTSGKFYITNCWNQGAVRGYVSVGGVVGGAGLTNSGAYTWDTAGGQAPVEVFNCLNTGTISKYGATTLSYGGGIVGATYSYNGVFVDNCYNQGKVYPQTSSTSPARPIIGYATTGYGSYSGTLAASRNPGNWALAWVTHTYSLNYGDGGGTDYTTLIASTQTGGSGVGWTKDNCKIGYKAALQTSAAEDCAELNAYAAKDTDWAPVRGTSTYNGVTVTENGNKRDYVKWICDSTNNKLPYLDLLNTVGYSDEAVNPHQHIDSNNDGYCDEDNACMHTKGENGYCTSESCNHGAECDCGGAAPSITITPVSITAYVGGESANGGNAPKLRYQVTTPDGVSLDNLTFTIHTVTINDEGTALVEEIALTPTPIDGSAYYLFPELGGTLNDPSNVAAGTTTELEPDTQVQRGAYLKLVDEDATSETYAGVYRVEKRTSETASWDNWYITATGTDGETYAVNVVTEIAEQPITITIRGVSDESAMHNEIQSDLTPNDFLAPVATTWQQDSTGFAAVVDGNTTFTTNDDAALGVLSPVTNGAAASAGIQNDNSSNFVSLLVDNLLTESNGGELTEASLIQQAKEQSDLELDIDFDEETINYDFRYLDLVNPQDGNAVVTANGNVTIYWPYPEGITYENAGDYAFQVLHYKGMDRTYTVDNTDPLSDVTVEKLDAEATENGISFTTSSFCPFVLMWSANEDPDGQDPDGQDPDEQDPDGQDPDGQDPDEQDPDEQDPDGQDPDGQDPDEQDPDGQDPDEQDPDGQDPDGQDPDGQDPDGQDPDEQDPDNQGSDNQGSDNQGSDNQGSDNQGSDNQDSSNQGSSNRGSGSRGAGKHSATYRGTNTNNVTETTVTQPTGTAVTESGTGTTGRVPNMLNGKNGSAYIMGYPDGSVKPLANISRAEVATIFFRLLKDEVRDANLTERNAFTDVSQGDWYNATISTMAALGIVRGRSEEIFDPNADITRAEFAAICSRFDNTAVETDPNTFSDISGNWAEGEILRVAALGWMKGYPDGTFAPEQSITRAEAVTVINRILQRASELKDQQNNMNTWWDNMDPEKWYYMDMQMAANSYDYQS